MVVADIPPNEEERLAALEEYAVLDTEFEREYDELCQLAATLCGTPVALISLIDRKRQWFKSSVGLDVRETSRDLAFCAHALWHESVFEVPDATQDHRFADNPLVTGSPDIRFYAGKPLITPTGHALGTLCVLDRVPRQLVPAQRQALEILARQVITHLELRKTSRALQKSNREKEEFLGVVAHDLRSPLSGLASLSDYLLEEMPALAPSDVTEIVTSLNASIHLAYDLAENLLTWALLEQGRMTFRPELLGAADLVALVLAPLALPFRLKQVAVRTEIDPALRVHGDRAMIETALRNLVSNAVKFSKSGQEVCVRGRVEGERVGITVEDLGMGMSPDVLAGLQEGPKAQSRLGTAGERGSGLGLTLVRQFAARNQGNLELRSVPGQGTSATLWLPATQPVAQQS